jgi:hypothetical protein
VKLERLLKAQKGILVSVGFVASMYAIVVFAYNPFQDQVLPSNTTVQPRWSSPAVTWMLNPTLKSNVDTTHGTNPVSVSTALTNAFNIWNTTKINNQLLSNLTIKPGPPTTLTDPDSNDCQNTISFVPSSVVSFPTGAIAFTQVSTVGLNAGESGPCGTSNTSGVPVGFIFDADMVFNPKNNFSTSWPPLSGDYDVQSVAAHEFGHLLGLDHSGIAHVMMFPFADSGVGQQRALATDDVVGAAYMYPAASFATATGAISGTVALDGEGAFASHVIIIDATTGEPVIDRLTNMDGAYKILGVPPGTYNVLALPLGQDANSGIFILDDFSGWACGYGEQSPPCCDSTTDASCTGTPLQNPTNYSGRFF